jgi:hypothetical protein
MADYAKVGDHFDEPKPSVFELVIEDLAPYVNPADFGLSDISGINPADYYITSGDAVEKAKVLEKVIWKHAGDLRRRSYEIVAEENGCTPTEAQSLFRSGTRPQSPIGFADYESAIWKAAGNSRKLRNALEKAKGVNCFLETEWDNHRLLCIPKNPRK